MIAFERLKMHRFIPDNILENLQLLKIRD